MHGVLGDGERPPGAMQFGPMVFGAGGECRGLLKKCHDRLARSAVFQLTDFESSAGRTFYVSTGQNRKPLISLYEDVCAPFVGRSEPTTVLLDAALTGDLFDRQNPLALCTSSEGLRI